MDQLMEEARRQVLLEQNRTSEALTMQDFLGVMNGIVDGFLKDHQQHQSDAAVEKNSKSENDSSSATPSDDSNQDDQVPKKVDSKENTADAECPKQKWSHPGPLKDYFAAIDAIVNAMSKNQHDQKTDDEENSTQSENSSDKNADQRSKGNNNDITDDEQQHPMKDFLTVMDTIVGTLMNPHRNGNSNSEKKDTDNKTEVDKLSGGNVDNNVIDQTIKTPAASSAAGAEKDEPQKELLAAAAATENEVKEVLKNQVV